MRDDALLRRVDAYFHAAPLSGATADEVGPFTLFRSTLAWPYYARPRPEAGSPTPTDLRDLIHRCEELGLPVSIEWVVETAPDVGPLVQQGGLEVQSYPLLVLTRETFTPVAGPQGYDVAMIGADPGPLGEAAAVADVGFANGGTAPGVAGVAERDRRMAEFGKQRLADIASRVARGFTRTAVARDLTEQIVASGSHQPVGSATEIVGVATLPAYRRRGLGAAVTSLLVEDALTDDGIDLVLLSAGGDEQARVYENVGFRRIGHTGAAEFPSP